MEDNPTRDDEGFAGERQSPSTRSTLDDGPTDAGLTQRGNHVAVVFLVEEGVDVLGHGRADVRNFLQPPGRRP